MDVTQLELELELLVSGAAQGDDEERLKSYGAVLRALAADSSVNIKSWASFASNVVGTVRLAGMDIIHGEKKMKISALELLSWILTVDGVRFENVLQVAAAELASVRRGVLSALEEGDADLKTTALFLVAEQCHPELFAPEATRLLSGLGRGLAELGGRRTADHSCDSPESIVLLYTNPAVMEACLRPLIDTCLLSRNPRVLRESLCLLGGGLMKIKEIPTVRSFVLSETKYLMDSLSSVMLEGPLVCGEVAGVWRAWARLIPPGDLCPLLRLGSSGRKSAGYLLKPVEKMFSLEGAEARMEAALCWKTLVLQVIVVENWINDLKIVRLILRCIIYNLENEKHSHNVVGIMRDCLQRMLSEVWPNVSAVLDLGLSSSSVATTRSSLQRMLCESNTEAQTIERTSRPPYDGLRVFRAACAVSLLYLNPWGLSGGRRNDEVEDSGETRSFMEVPLRPLFLTGYQDDFDEGFALKYLQKGGLDDFIELIRCICVAIRHLIILMNCDEFPSETCEPAFSSHFLESTIARSVFFFQQAIQHIGIYVVQNSLPDTCSLLSPEGKAVRGPNQSPEYNSALKSKSPNTTPSEYCCHVIYTLDNDGCEQAVLTSAPPSVVEIVNAIFHEAILVLLDYLLARSDSKCIRYGELIIESLWWILHRFSGFEIALDHGDMLLLSNRLDSVLLKIWTQKPMQSGASVESTDSLPGRDGSQVPAVMLGAVLAMSILSACNCQSSSHQQELGMSSLSFAIKRCMKSITESKTLPIALRWLPKLVSRITGECANRQSSASFLSEVELSENESIMLLIDGNSGEYVEMSCNKSLVSSEFCASCVIAIIETFANAAAMSLSKMPIDIDTAVEFESTGSKTATSSAYDNSLIENVLSGLINLLKVPLFLMTVPSLSLPSVPVYEIDEMLKSWESIFSIILRYDLGGRVAELLLRVCRMAKRTIIDSARVNRASTAKLLAAFWNCHKKNTSQKRPDWEHSHSRVINECLLFLLTVNALAGWFSALKMINTVSIDCETVSDSLCALLSIDLLQISSDFISSNLLVSKNLFGFLDLSTVTQPNLKKEFFEFEPLDAVSLRLLLDGIVRVNNFSSLLLKSQDRIDTKACLDAFYDFVSSFFSQLSKVLNSAIECCLTSNGNMRNESIRFSSLMERFEKINENFVVSNCGIKTELAKATLAQLLSEMRCRMKTITTDETMGGNGIFRTGMKRSYIRSTKSTADDTGGRKIAKYDKRDIGERCCNNEASGEYVKLCPAQPFSVQPRQWSDVPITYSSLDRECLLSQSQDHSSSSLIATSYGIPPIEPTSTKPNTYDLPIELANQGSPECKDRCLGCLASYLHVLIDHVVKKLLTTDQAHLISRYTVVLNDEKRRCIHCNNSNSHDYVVAQLEAGTASDLLAVLNTEIEKLNEKATRMEKISNKQHT